MSSSEYIEKPIGKTKKLAGKGIKNKRRGERKWFMKMEEIGGNEGRKGRGKTGLGGWRVVQCQPYPSHWGEVSLLQVSFRLGREPLYETD